MGHAHDHGPPKTGLRRAATPRERQENLRRLGWALVLSASYMVAEIVGGWLTGSLALLADAGHMASDVAALALAGFASWMAAKPASPQRTYGRKRAEILAALAQGAALVAVALVIGFEALERLRAPTPVLAPGMIAIASGGLVINAVALGILHGGRSSSLNMRGAFLHVLSDALGSIGAIAAGVGIWAFGWSWADPAASLAIAVLVVASAWHLLRDSVDVLMEAAPRDLDVAAIRAELSAISGIREVHDLHVWTIGSGEVSLSSHVVAKEGSEPGELLAQIYEQLGSSFGIDHATIQIEPPSFALTSPRDACPTDCEAPRRTGR